jgi:WD40 repeat protein
MRWRSVLVQTAARCWASASDDRTVRLWDPATGTTIVTLLRRTSPKEVATHGTQLAAADLEGMTVVEVVDSAG